MLRPIDHAGAWGGAGVIKEVRDLRGAVERMSVIARMKAHAVLHPEVERFSADTQHTHATQLVRGQPSGSAATQSRHGRRRVPGHTGSMPRQTSAPHRGEDATGTHGGFHGAVFGDRTRVCEHWCARRMKLSPAGGPTHRCPRLPGRDRRLKYQSEIAAAHTPSQVARFADERSQGA